MSHRNFYRSPNWLIVVEWCQGNRGIRTHTRSQTFRPLDHHHMNRLCSNTNARPCIGTQCMLYYHSTEYPAGVCFPKLGRFSYKINCIGSHTITRPNASSHRRTTIVWMNDKVEERERERESGVCNLWSHFIVNIFCEDISIFVASALTSN